MADTYIDALNIHSTGKLICAPATYSYRGYFDYRYKYIPNMSAPYGWDKIVEDKRPWVQFYINSDGSVHYRYVKGENSTSSTTPPTIDALDGYTWLNGIQSKFSTLMSSRYYDSNFTYMCDTPTEVARPPYILTRMDLGWGNRWFILKYSSGSLDRPISSFENTIEYYAHYVTYGDVSGGDSKY